MRNQNFSHIIYILNSLNTVGAKPKTVVKTEDGKTIIGVIKTLSMSTPDNAEPNQIKLVSTTCNSVHAVDLLEIQSIEDQQQ